MRTLDRELPWHKHVEDARRAAELAEEAYKSGNMISHDFWRKREAEKAEDGRRAKRRQEARR